MTQESTYFDRMAGKWDDARRQQRTQALADDIFRRVAFQASQEVLDYGAGTGQLSLLLAPRVRSVCAADASRGMLSVLENKLRTAGPVRIELLLWNAEQDPPPQRTFDVIVSSMTFHHLRDIPRVLNIFHSLLRRDGQLAVADLDQEDGDFHASDAGALHRGFKREELMTWCSQAGFRDIRIETAHTIQRKVSSGEDKAFSIFLLTARA